MSPARVVVRTQGPAGDPGDPTLVADGAIPAAKITGTAVITTDPRLTDARTPTAHAASHGYASTDPTLALAAAPFPRITELDKSVLTTFQAGHGYSNNAGGSANLNYTTEYVLGTQCVQAVTDGAATAKTIRKLAFSAVDCTAKQPLLTFKIENPNEVAAFQLYLGDATLTNYYRWELKSSQGQQWATDGEWVTISLSWGDATTTGSPSRSAITSAQYRIVDTASGTGVTCYLQEISLVPEPATTFPVGVVTFTCDDGWAAQHSVMRPALDKYRYAACAYLISDLVDGSGRLTTAQIRQMRAAGWDIGLHAYLDINHAASWSGVDEATLALDVGRQRAWSVEKFGAYGVDHAALPLGQFQPQTTLSGAHTLPAVTITVASTAGFPDAGTIILPGNQRVTYTGKTATAFTGCSGGSGPQIDGARVAQYATPHIAIEVGRRFCSTIRSINQKTTETWPPADPHKLRVLYITGTSAGTTLTAAKAAVDKAKANREWLILVFHDFAEGATTTSGSHTLPVATITVASTSGFASSGALWVNSTQYVTYTGTTATTFTGCSGGTGVIGTGSDVRAAGTTTLKWSAQDFRELVDYVAAQAVPVRTFTALARA